MVRPARRLLGQDGGVAWVCPACDRRFGRTGQSHTCVPVVSLDDWFGGRPPEQRAVGAAVIAHLEQLGEIDVEAAQVGIFLKRDRLVAELRPFRDHLRLTLVLDDDVDSPRIGRRIRPTRTYRRHVLYVSLPTVADVDDEVRAWLTRAYEEG
jgi:hypothetical protein